MKTSEIKELAIKELEERLDAERTVLIKLKMNHAVSPLDNPMKIKSVRKDVARMCADLRRRQLSDLKK